VPNPKGSLKNKKPTFSGCLFHLIHTEREHITTYQPVLDFWFSEAAQPYWFAQSNDFDQTIRTQFANVFQAAVTNQLADWRNTMHGRVAEILVLDQFSRNIYRDQAQDAARLAAGARSRCPAPNLPSCRTNTANLPCLPYMHSESLAVHQAAQPSFAQYTNENVQDFERKHYDLIAQFGRYPHRNALLARTNTPKETQFLAEHGRGF